MRHRLAKRFHVWWAVAARSRLKPIGAVVVVIGVFDTVQAQVFPNADIPVIASVVPGLPVWAWGMVVMAAVVLAVLEGCYQVAAPHLPEDQRPVKRMGWLDLQIEGFKAIEQMAPRLKDIGKETAWIGEKFRKHAPRVAAAMQGDPEGLQRTSNRVAKDVNRFSKRLERHLPKICEEERAAAALFLSLVERVDEGEVVVKLSDATRQMLSEEGFSRMLVGATSLLSSVDDMTKQAPTGNLIEATERMNQGLARLIAGTAMLFECGYAFVDAADARIERGI